MVRLEIKVIDSEAVVVQSSVLIFDDVETAIEASRAAFDAASELEPDDL